VAAGCDNREAPCAGLGYDVGKELAQHGARRDDRWENTCRYAHPVNQRSGPIPSERIQALAGTGDGALAHLAAGEPVVEQIGNEEQGLCHLQEGIISHHHRKELVERVDLHELDACGCEDLLTRNSTECLLEHSVRAAVPVMVGIAQQHPRAVQQREVNAPCIQARTHQAVACCTCTGRHCPGQPLLDLAVQPCGVPIQACAVRRAQGHRPVRKAVHLLQSQTLSIEASNNRASPRCAEVQCQVVLRRHRSASRLRMSAWAQHLSGSEGYHDGLWTSKPGRVAS